MNRIEQNQLDFFKIVDLVIEVLHRETVGPEPLDKFWRFFNYLKSGVISILETEKIALAYEPTAKEIEAGMDRFEGLGVYMQTRSLTGGDITKFEAVRRLPYSFCFTELNTVKQLHYYQQE